MFSTSSIQAEKKLENGNHQTGSAHSSFLDSFLSITRKYAFLHFGFAVFLLLQISLFVLFFSFLANSAIVAFCVGVFFLSFFSYLVLRFYFEAKKPEFFASIKEEFLKSCEKQTAGDKNHVSVALAEALQKLASDFQNLEFSYYSTGNSTFSILLQKLSAYLHWKDVLNVKATLYHAIIEQYLSRIKETPTDVEVHAALAEAYTLLAQIYRPPSHALWISNEYYSQGITDKWKAACQYAIEELKIICDYLPNDPWAHAKLASLYHQMNWFEQEICEYETILQICPNDADILFRLGVLYFEQGHTSKGLKIYERMKKGRFAKADELIALYDAKFVSKT